MKRGPELEPSCRGEATHFHLPVAYVIDLDELVAGIHLAVLIHILTWVGQYLVDDQVTGGTLIGGYFDGQFEVAVAAGNPHYIGLPL